jgi:hypothetical protein
MPRSEDRWPPVYDADDLVAQIRQLVRHPDMAQRFYDWRRDRDISPLADVCQGDLVRLNSDIPVVGADGTPGVVPHHTDYWMVTGNTCDFARAAVQWTQFVPVVRLGGPELPPVSVAALRSYSAFRSFYLPPWTPAEVGTHHAADFTTPVTIDKAAITTHAQVDARMGRASWVLLNACLVRFLARGDGRYAP